MTTYKIGIVGGAGYTAGELLRLTQLHEPSSLAWVQSESQAGKSIGKVHPDLMGDLEDVSFVADIPTDGADVVFLCKGHGESKGIMSNGHFDKTRVIDLSQDFRLSGDHDFVYGLPELNRNQIMDGLHIANPGCFATAIQLGLLPAIQSGIISSDVHISGITGSTGAGQQLSRTSHFSWRNNNMSVYKAFTHQHMDEVGASIHQADPAFSHEINFIPYRGNFTRGIIITSYFNSSASEDEVIQVYEDFYQDAAFTKVVDQNPDLKMVVNTNKCLVFPHKHGKKVMVISVIDNLLKGASGQAIQNMNLMLGLDEKTGLKLKATVF